ncbi:hypothetical protein [Paenibacillus sp. TH7-28]
MNRIGKTAYITGSLALASALLAGCQGNDEPELGVANVVQEEQQASEFVGKIKSIEGQTITVYRALDAEGEQASTETGLTETGLTETDLTKAGPAETSSTEAASSEGGSTEDTIEVTLTEDTIIIAAAGKADAGDVEGSKIAGSTEDVVSSGNAESTAKAGNSMTSGSPGTDNGVAVSELTLDDLKVGDVVSIHLKEGTTEATRIEVMAAFLPEGTEPATGKENTKNTEAPDVQEKSPAEPSQNAGGKPVDGQRPNGGAPAGGQPPAGRQPPADGQPPEGGQPARGEGGSPANGKQGDKTSSQAANANQGAANSDQSSQSAAKTGSTGTPQGPGNPAQSGGGTMGKIKSISGEQITVYVASAPPQGAVASSGEQLEPPAKETAPDNASGETAVITVTSDTKLVSVIFSVNQMVESEISLSELQEGSMIQYTLAENSTDALKIAVSPAGGPGEMSGPGPGGNAEQTTTSAE